MVPRGRGGGDIGESKGGGISEKFHQNILWQVAAFIHIQSNIEKNKSKSKEYKTIQVKYLIF